MFDQPEFESVLRANLKRNPQIELRGDTEVTSVADDGQGRIRVTFVDHTEREGVLNAAYVLGCDGANSIVRRDIDVSMHDLRFAQRWLVIDIATTADLHQWEGVHQVCDPVRAGTYMRIGETRYRWEFRLRQAETAGEFQDLTALWPLLAPWTAHLEPADLKIIRVAEYSFRAQIAEQWRRGNVFLLGDAAHLTPPFIGQGLGSGLRDAMNLAWKLAGVLMGDLSASVLDSYEQERKPHARDMIRMALRVGQAMTAGGEFGNLIRRALIPTLTLLPTLRMKIVDSATPALRKSALVHRSRVLPRNLPGTLCPNPLHGQQRLDAYLGGRFALISARQLTKPEQAVADERGAVVIVVDPDTELADWLRHGHAGAAIVRPDRTVMAASARAGEMVDVLPRFQPSSSCPPPITAVIQDDPPPTRSA
jgi:3-(3-hydroxy-phenyl)propionate hydroxylase